MPTEFTVECRCECGWFMLLPEDGVNFPCERPVFSDTGKPLGSCGKLLSVSTHATALTFRRRVAALLSKIQHSGDTISKFGGCCPVCWKSRSGSERHAPDCALAALLKEAETP